VAPKRFHNEANTALSKKRASDRSFGLVFLVVFLIIAAYLWWHGKGGAVYFAAAGAVFGALALLAPQILAPANWIWTKFGLLLHRLISPIVITALFFLVITPVGLLMRAVGQTPLALKLDTSARSYWINRKPGPVPASMKRQY
jgi:hypothetical protein